METTALNDRMNIREYFETIFEIMRSPAKYFERTSGESGSRRALFFLMISAIFYCSVSMAYFYENSLAMGAIMMANAVVMPAFAAAITFILLAMTGQARIPYGRVFNIYAYTGGAVMVVSWIPGLAVVMEPVRAVLVGVGLVKSLGVKKLKAAFLVMQTAVLLLLFFWTAAPLILKAQTIFN